MRKVLSTVVVVLAVLAAPLAASATTTTQYAKSAGFVAGPTGSGGFRFAGTPVKIPSLDCTHNSNQDATATVFWGVGPSANSGDVPDAAIGVFFQNKCHNGSPSGWKTYTCNATSTLKCIDNGDRLIASSVADGDVVNVLVQQAIGLHFGSNNWYDAEVTDGQGNLQNHGGDTYCGSSGCFNNSNRQYAQGVVTNYPNGHLADMTSGAAFGHVDSTHGVMQLNANPNDSGDYQNMVSSEFDSISSTFTDDGTSTGTVCATNTGWNGTTLSYGVSYAAAC